MDREEKILKALANKRRIEILRLLQKSKDGINVKEIANKIRLSIRSTSRHLIRLEQAGLIKKNRFKNFMISRVPAQIWQILDLLKKLFYRKR